MNLFDSYGWQLDTTVSIEQRNKELLEMDYEKTKSFLEYMSNGIEFDNFEPTQQSEDNAPKALSNPNSRPRSKKCATVRFKALAQPISSRATDITNSIRTAVRLPFTSFS